MQDELVDIVYELDNSAILHGGTTIRRCYGSNRFSKDLNFYSGIQRDFSGAAPAENKTKGLDSAKIQKTENLAFSKISNENAEVWVELNFSRDKKNSASFEMRQSLLPDTGNDFNPEFPHLNRVTL